MLHLKKVLGAKPKEHVESELDQMLTPWGENLDTAAVLQEHPNPQFARTSYEILNGTWTCAFVESGHDPATNLAEIVEQAQLPDSAAFDQPIVVPFSPEALLSGVERQLQPDELLWYKRSFACPNVRSRGKHATPQRALLHFQAVDFACAVRVNGTLVGSHVGGYLPFAFDITDALAEGDNELAVCVADPSEFGGHLRGKQRFDRGDIWYTAQSGIWQTVWIEYVPAVSIECMRIEPDLDTGILAIGAQIRNADSATPAPPRLGVEVLTPEGDAVASAECEVTGTTCAIAVHVANPRAWSPDDPYLYHLRLRLGADTVTSYCGFRSVRVQKDESGNPRVFLNGKPLFIEGILDQAYWSDGLMTAPSDDALLYDIRAMRDAGFNLMRKHIKVECARWYYHCDRLGMLVLQDMVSGGDAEIKTWHWSYKPTLFKVSWNHYRDDTPSHRENLGAGDARYRDEWTADCRETVQLLGNHPSIIGWSLFNEGWGQFDAKDACAMVRKMDPSRFIDAVSGWYDQRCGDMSSVHNYFRDMKVWADRKHGRAFFVSEFGGFTHRVEGHSSLAEAYGYEPFDDRDAWRAAIQDALREMRALEPKGLAGYVYTQVSDIEEETNGILTYDRRINKLAD